MAKDPNKMNMKDRIKKVTPDNEWLKNVAKSFGLSSLEVVKELMPNTYSTLDWNKGVINVNDLITDIRDNNGVRKMFTRQLNNLPHIKMAHEALENAKADLKSGNINNTNRLLGLDDNGDFNFDDFSSFDSGGFEIIDEDDDGTIDSVEGDLNNQRSTTVNVIETLPLAKAISSSSQATVGAITALGEQNLAIESEKMMMDKQMFNASLNALNTINENLALLVQFNSDSTVKYHAAAIEYFEHMTNRYAKDDEEENREKIKDKLLNPFTAEGGLKLDEYAEVIKKNLTDIKDSNIVLSGVYDFLSNPQLLEGMVKNPLGFLMQEGIKKLLSSQFKRALGDIDKNLNSVLPALLARINTFEDSDDPLLKKLNEIFGYKHKMDSYVDLGEYEKGAISWDGISKKTLVDVIPTYLRRIESAITGAGERVFNYSTGKFTDVKSIKEYYDDKKSNVEVSGFYNVRSSVNDVINRLDLSSEARDQVKKDFDEYFRKMTNEGHLIRHNKRKNKFGNETSELYESGVGGYDLDRVNLMARILDEVPQHIKTEMGTTAITDSRERTHKFYQEIKDDPTLHGYSILHNNSIDIDKAKYNKEGLGLGRNKDRFGLSELDYLRDIRTALINGIKVFPDNRKRYKGNQNPNASLLAKQRSEEEEYKNKIADEERRRKEDEEQKNMWSTKGRSIHDAANMFDSSWNKMFPKENKIDADGEGKITKKVDSLNESIQDLIYQILYGEDDYREKALEKLKRLYGKSKPIMKSMKDFYGDTIKAFKCFFTGQGYVTSDGIKVEGEQSLLGSIKDTIFGVKEKVKGSFKSGGMFNRFFDDFADGFKDFKISLFGEKGVQEGKETFQNLMGKIKQRLPKALGVGLGTGLVKTAFASNLGLLGNFLLPGGPLGAVLTGTAFSMLKQSETFNRYMFGEKDKDGNRVGGLISKAWQDKYQEYKGVIGKGAGIGLLASFFLPGGPITGALLGIGTSIASKNEAFQEILYGKDFKEKDKKSLANGIFGKMFKRFAGDESGVDNPKLAKFLGATGLGVGIAQGVGLLPSFLLPGGPIMGAMLGLAAGITASSNKFQNWLLGEKDIDGQRYGGLLHKAANWFNLTFAQPLKLKAVEFNDFLYGMMRKHIFDPITRSFEPVLYAVKNVFINVKDSLVNAFTSIANPIVQAFKDIVIKPTAKLIKKLLFDPMKWILKKTLGLVTKSIVSVATLPLKALGWAADKYNSHSAVRQEKYRRIREYDKTTPKEERNYSDRKKAGKLSREEKKELRKSVPYRNGKTWGQKKKEQNDELKEEMLKRKERRKEMEKQFKEDKKFAKANNWKYSSKKQQERREAELKEKERWYQEQQLMQAQDTDGKVEKISDNVIELKDYQKETGSKLDAIKNTVKEGFDKLVNSFNKGNGTPAQQSSDSEDHMAKIYDFLDEKERRGYKPSDMILPPKDYGKVTDEDLQPIRDFLDDDKPSTLKGALDDLPNDFKGVFKGKEYDNVIDVRYKDKKEKPVKWSPSTSEEKSNIPTPEPKGVIDLEAVRKRLRKDDQSHAEGLEKVPEDGYIAELHKDEMVVPKKPAGKLRSMMGGLGSAIGGLSNLFSSVFNAVSEDDRRDREDNALGLSDAEEDRVNELEDRKRRDQIVNKDGDIEEKEKPDLLTRGLNGIGSLLGFHVSKREQEDDALGLNDHQEDMMKEIEDRERKEKVSRKNVDFIQEKVAANAKERADRKWKESLLEAVRHVGNFAGAAASGTINLFDLIGKGIGKIGDLLDGGFSWLKTLGLPAAVTALTIIGDNYQESEEYIEAHTDKDGNQITDNYDLVKFRPWISAREQLVFKPLRTIKNKLIDPAVDTGKKVYEGGKNTYNKIFGKSADEAVDAVDGNVIDFGVKKAAKESAEEGTGKIVKEGVEKGIKNGGKVIKFPDAKITKGAVDSTNGKTLKKAADAADDSGLIGKLVKWGKESVQILGEKIGEKFPKAKGLGKKLLGLSDEIFGTLLKNSDGILARFAKKITATFTKIGAGASTGFLLDVGLAAIDAITGATAGNAGNLFGVSPDNVDGTMRVISSVIQAVFNFNFMSIISLINEITNMMFNFNFLRSLAIWAYNLFGGDQNLDSRITAKQIDQCTSIDQALGIMGITNPVDLQKLKDKKGNWKNFAEVDNKELGGVITPTEQMELARLQYNLENGTKVSSQAFIDQESKTVGTKFMDWITPDTANEKKAKYENKSDEHRKKAEESKTWFGKTYHNWRANKNEEKAKKTEEKAKKKKAKAEEKAAYHKEKAEESDSWLGRTYHNWRAKRNEKKIEKYTINEDNQVVNESTSQPTAEISNQQAMEAKANIIPADRIQMMYPKMQEGDVVVDRYGNKYDHTGKCIYSPSMDIEGDAGTGDGEEAVMVDEYGNQYDANGKLIKSKEGKEGKAETSTNKKKDKKGWFSKVIDPLGVKKKVNDAVVGGVKKGKEKAVELYQKGKKEFKELASNPAAYMLNRSSEMVDAAYNKGKEIYNKGKEKVTEIKDKVIDGVKNNKTVKKVTDYVQDKYNKAKDAITAGIEEGDSAGTKAGKIVRNIITTVNDQMKKIAENIKKGITDTVKNIGDSFKKGIENIKKGFKTLITETPKKIGELKDNISEGFKNGLSKVKTGFKNTMTNLKEGISKKTDDLKETFSKENIKKKLTEKADEVKKAWGKFTSTFGKIFDEFKGKFEDWKKKFKDFKLPSLKFSDIKIGWDKVITFFKDFASALIAKDPDKIKVDNEGGGAGPSIPLNQQIKPKNYVFTENDREYKEKDRGATVGGLKDKGNTHNFPYFAQSDNRWGKERLMGGKTLGDVGCGPTSTAMVLTHLTGQYITPDTTAKAGSQEHLPGTTTYNYFPEIADKFNLNYSEANDIKSIRARLTAGQPVILSGFDASSNNVTPYTTDGHIVVATGIQGNNVQINDPRGPGYSGSYSIGNVIKGLKRGIVLSSTNDTESVGLPSSGTFSTTTQMTGKLSTTGDLPTSDEMEVLGGDAGQIKLWEKVIGYAKAFKEKLKYSYGSTAINNNGMSTDCSAFTQHVMKRAAGLDIPRTSAEQKNAGAGVDKSQAQAGDLVVWKGHVGLVIDSNKNMIDAGSNNVPKIRSYETDYWRSRGDYVIRRVLSNPNELVSAKVDNPHTGIGFSGIVDPQGGQDLAGGVSTGATSSGETVESNDTMGIFAQMSSIGDKLLSSIYNGKNMFIEPTSTTSSSTDGSTVDISGISDVATAVWKFFTGKGYSKQATAGIMGNLQQESGMNPTRKQSGGGPGRGIAQWTVNEGRFKGLQSHAQSKGKDWTDLQSQLEWIDLELNGKDSSTASILKKNYGGIQGLKSATDTRWAVEAFEKSFERAGKPNLTNRYKYAENFYTQMTNAGMGPSMATAAQAAPTDGTIPSSMNGWKYYQQSDSKWSGQVGSSTVSRGGCGPTSAAMMLSTIFGKEINPLTMTKWAHDNGTWNGAMQWSMPHQVAKAFGLQMTELGAVQNGVDEKVLGYVKEAIRAGKPVMLTGKGKGASGSAASTETPFTPGGHVVLAVGIDGSGNLIINDPRGANRSKAYTDDGILNIGPGLRGAWAFDPNGGSIPSTITTDGDFTGGTTTGATSSGETVESNDTMGIFSKMSNMGNMLLSSIYNEKNMFTNAGSGDGDGKTYMINPKKDFKYESIEKQPKPTGDAGKGDKVTYNKSITNNTTNNTTDVNAQRNLDGLNRRVNAVMSGMNSSDPAVYTEVLKLIMEELQAINKNTAATATNVKNIEIVSSNTPVNGIQTQEETTKERYMTTQQKRMPDRLQTINQSTGYNVARDIAGYKKKK